ncbi:hypothetical protein [Helicobacter heilmannii]|uniref:hypothetical protein n=1 Tax=Helicobacter heilmannii TaxID=35817 RepID=UPI000CF17B04|nr:hypothetical protein [Helicobacter heilmannii]
MVFGSSPTTFSVPQTLYFNPPSSNNNQPTANLTTGKLNTSSQGDLSQANNALNDIFQAVSGLVNSSPATSFSANNNPFSAYLKALQQDFLGTSATKTQTAPSGIIQTIGETLATAYTNATNNTLNATGLGGALYSIDQLFNSIHNKTYTQSGSPTTDNNPLIYQNGNGQYKVDASDLQALNTLSNINADFDCQLVSSQGVLNKNYTAAVDLLTANANPSGVGSLVQKNGVYCQQHSQHQHECYRQHTPSNTASSDVVLTALGKMSSATDTSGLQGLINPNNYANVYQDYKSISSQLSTLADYLGFSGSNHLAMAFNAGLDLGILSGKLHTLNSGYNNFNVGGFAGNSTWYIV